MKRNVFEQADEGPPNEKSLVVHKELFKSIIQQGGTASQYWQLKSFLEKNPGVEVKDIHFDIFKVGAPTIMVNFEPVRLKEA